MKGPCDHGITFDERECLQECLPEMLRRPMSSYEVRKRWPRLSGQCPLGCGYTGTFYASFMHYVAGDW